MTRRCVPGANEGDAMQDLEVTCSPSEKSISPEKSKQRVKWFSSLASKAAKQKGKWRPCRVAGQSCKTPTSVQPITSPGPTQDKVRARNKPKRPSNGSQSANRHACGGLSKSEQKTMAPQQVLLLSLGLAILFLVDFLLCLFIFASFVQR